MKINFSTFKLITKNDRKKNLPSFKNIKKDTFEHSNIILIKNWDSVVKGEIVKKIILKDLSGKKVKGYILKDISRENQYFVCANGKNQCRMIISEDEDSIYIEELYGHNNIGEFKGAGTELLKFASEISLEKGYKGKLSLKMGGSFPFYYKNNFRIDENHTDDVNIKNAALDYITREGVPKNKLWLAHWSTPIVILDEKNAKLMRNSKRLIDSSKSAVLYSKNINLKNKTKFLDVDFCDLDNKFVIQLIDKNSEQYSMLAYIEGDIKNGKLIWNNEIKSNLFYQKNPEIIRELNTAFNYAQDYYRTKCFTK